MGKSEQNQNNGCGIRRFNSFCRHDSALKTHKLLKRQGVKNAHLRAIPTRASNLNPACGFLCLE